MPDPHCETCSCSDDEHESDTLYRCQLYLCPICQARYTYRPVCRECRPEPGRPARYMTAFAEPVYEPPPDPKPPKPAPLAVWCACGDIRDVHGDDGCRVPSCGCSGFRPERRQTGGAMEVRL
jgi:hypothetical protein